MITPTSPILKRAYADTSVLSETWISRDRESPSICSSSCTTPRANSSFSALRQTYVRHDISGIQQTQQINGLLSQTAVQVPSQQPSTLPSDQQHAVTANPTSRKPSFKLVLPPRPAEEELKLQVNIHRRQPNGRSTPYPVIEQNITLELPDVNRPSSYRPQYNRRASTPYPLLRDGKVMSGSEDDDPDQPGFFDLVLSPGTETETETETEMDTEMEQDGKGEVRGCKRTAQDPPTPFQKDIKRPPTPYRNAQ